MAYVKKYNTPEERHRAAVAAGKLGAAALTASGNRACCGGRKPGSKNKVHHTPGDPKLNHNINLRDEDYAIFERVAACGGMTRIELMHRIAVRLKEKNPGIFLQAEPNMI